MLRSRSFHYAKIMKHNYEILHQDGNEGIYAIHFLKDYYVLFCQGSCAMLTLKRLDNVIISKWF